MANCDIFCNCVSLLFVYFSGLYFGVLKVVLLVNMVMVAAKLAQQTVDQTVKHVTMIQGTVGMDVKPVGKGIAALKVGMCFKKNYLMKFSI